MAQVALTYSYVYFGASGPHERRPVRTPGGPGGFELISQKSGGTLQTGDQFEIGVPLPPTQLVNRVTYNFAFVNVSGGTPSGAQVSFDSANPPPFVTVASSPINVLVLYVPPPGGNGGPPGGSGATIDSFDETTGSLFNDIFVSVAPDPGGVLTTSGNNLGFVDTTNSKEAITAISPTSSGVIFDQWRILLPPGPVETGRVLTVGKGVSVNALAFYKAPPPQPPDPCSQAVAFLQQIIKDHGLPPLLLAQFNQVKATLEECV